MHNEHKGRFSASVSVIIMTLNEEENIEQCLKSLNGWSDDIHVIDSNSTDHTSEIALKYTNNIYSINKGHWSDIRNWSLQNLSLKHEWVLSIDADEFLTKELKEEIIDKIDSDPIEIGFYIKKKFIFIGKWLKYGEMYGKMLRLYKHDKVKYIKKGDAECTIYEGNVSTLKNDMIHQDLKPFSKWIDKHNQISTLAAKRYKDLAEKNVVTPYNLNKNGLQRIVGRPWLECLWDKTPSLARPFLMFGYLYFFKLGFLDGKLGLIYHLHHAFWYQLLIYTKLREIELLISKQ